MRITLKSINDQLAKMGIAERLAKGDRYFYFSSGDAENWLDRTVTVSALSNLTLDQWIEEYERLKRLNEEILSSDTRKPNVANEEQPLRKSREHK